MKYILQVATFYSEAIKKVLPYCVLIHLKKKSEWTCELSWAQTTAR